MRQEMEKRGADVVDVVTHVGNGMEMDWLMAATWKAQRKRAKLVAESTDRFVRSQFYNSNVRPDAQATILQLGELRMWTQALPLVTLIHPDSSPSEVRSYQRKRGQRLKDRKGGRPPKNTEQHKLLQAVWDQLKRIS